VTEPSENPYSIQGAGIGVVAVLGILIVDVRLSKSVVSYEFFLSSAVPNQVIGYVAGLAINPVQVFRT
jgi:hypothetical protein